MHALQKVQERMSSLAGKIVRSPHEYEAFVPNDLPPNIEWTTQLVHALSRADYCLGMLAREGGKLPNPHLFIRPFVAKEAVLSSRIEGFQTTLDEVLAANADHGGAQKNADLQEVQNYIAALDYGIARLQTLPLSLRLIRELHARLMQGVRGAHATPGEFRCSQNWIGVPGCSLKTAKFVPPPPDHLMDCLSHFEKFLHNKQLPPLIHIALCHYQFEAIHPFLDGNGRVGRLLITLLLIERNLLATPLLYLSAFFEATRNDYYRLLHNVSMQGSWEDWLIYFLSGVALQSEDVFSRAERIKGLLQQWELAVATSGSQIPVKIVRSLAVNPYITTKKVAATLHVAYSTAHRGIQKLESAGIVTMVGDAKRDKIYCATQLLRILDEPTKIDSST